MIKAIAILLRANSAVNNLFGSGGIYDTFELEITEAYLYDDLSTASYSSMISRPATRTYWIRGLRIFQTQIIYVAKYFNATAITTTSSNPTYTNFSFEYPINTEDFRT